MQHFSARISLGGAALVAVVATWLASSHPFFWDTVQLGAKHADFFYRTGFATWLLPDEMDSGHPPGFGLYLAACWAFFGQSLAVSHWAMLPFVLGILWLGYAIGRYIAPGWAWLFPWALAANPVLASQMLLISPDTVLTAGFLLAAYGLFSRNNWAQMMGALILASISTRGMMAVAALYLAGALSWPLPPIRIFARKALPYVPAGLLALVFLVSHYLAKGWIGYHSSSPWAPSFEGARGWDWLKHAFILGWRLSDFGLVFAWLAGIAAFAKCRRCIRQGPIALTARITLFALALFAPAFLLYQGLHQHRYLLPVMVGAQFLMLGLLYHSKWTAAWRYLLAGLSLIGPAAGHFWVYPERIAQGWDSSLAHWPHYQLRKDVIAFIEQQGIAPEDVGTAFPEIGPFHYRSLNGEKQGFAAKNLAVQSYIYYSNIMNDFSGQERAVLAKGWEVIFEAHRGGVSARLYRAKR
ncbi:hypothetical protein [Phaeodactylibacter luteus]|uniref:Glycosyltransferase RgtA/B/C/D-like domain-containing protein n=1 Tax=Phaeodactylibacter luteus TaxID=1564516 RepID=A0A5C6S6L0_9BACT|nr:hypothetical protein [Phaeodactylibacter luteus]TXB70136.1 hypothetical protein FRY97_00080 [Phaeodactylibacter luteus]